MSLSASRLAIETDDDHAGTRASGRRLGRLLPVDIRLRGHGRCRRERVDLEAGDEGRALVVRHHDGHRDGERDRDDRHEHRHGDDRGVGSRLVHCQAVAHSPHGLDQLGIAQLLAQRGDVHVERLAGADPDRIPHAREQLLPSNGPAGLLREDGQQVELLRGELDGRSVDG